MNMQTETVDGVEMPRPLARRCYLRESDPAGLDGRHMRRVLSSLRDEVLGVAMDRHAGHNRELALVATKLEEAELWAVRYGEKLGQLTTIDRQEVLGGQPSS